MSLPISVVLPTYNRAHCISRAIDSILWQSKSVGEIIIVNDGSFDFTLTALKAYGGCISIIEQENAGVSSARNAGILVAKYPWVAFLDSDDQWRTHKISMQWAYVKENPSCQLLHTNEWWYRHGRRVNPMKKHKKGGGNQFFQSLERCVISPSSVLVRRELLLKLGMFDTELPACEDYDLWLRICSQYNVDYLPESLLIKFGGHHDQLSRRYPVMDQFRVQALEKLLKSSILSVEQYCAARSVLIKKITIILNGAYRRNHHHLVDIYEKKLKQYQGSLS